ncbi:UDP-N-acetylglucosamine transferase subunit [Curvularia kusanoi]|uniref:UDP-N-acetylglucosamine transferase subunit ALG14 n=1 Tax=Curvularia kusanoi TaxID=90978 RepID=A0A9P4T818_CURKU|nr:UDP-N-acetylglucosamine transferase subunit [Curvularia kusanoi]
MPPALTSLYTLSFLLALLTTLFVVCSLRLLAILPNARLRPRQPRLRARPACARVLVVLGSGGHTHEMFALLRGLDARKYVSRTYVVSSGDAFSAGRAVAFETGLEARWNGGDGDGRGQGRGQGQESGMEGVGAASFLAARKTGVDADAESRLRCVGPGAYDIATIPRARRIHQPLYTTPFSALVSLAMAFKPLLAPDPPALIVTNGPATAVIVVLAAFILRFFDVRGVESKGLCRTVYVESFARVKTLSLSGKLLVHVVDRFLVQWEELKGYGGRAEYCGILV